MVGHIAVAKHEVKRLLEGQMTNLKTALLNLNIKVDEITVEHDKGPKSQGEPKEGCLGQSSGGKQGHSSSKTANGVNIAHETAKETLEDELLVDANNTGINYVI